MWARGPPQLDGLRICTTAAAVFTCTLRVRAARLTVHATYLGTVEVQSVAMVRLGIQGKWVHIDVKQLGNCKKTQGIRNDNIF